MKRNRAKFKGYKIINSVNDKIYIGITTTSLQKRLELHFLAMKYKPYKSALHNAMKKYGTDKFTIHLLKNEHSWEELCLWEKQTIISQNTKVPNGYNLSSGGEGAYGVERSLEFKKKLSNSKINYYKDPEKRKEQAIRMKIKNGAKDAVKKSVIRSTNLWKDPIYREKTTEAHKKAINTKEWKEKQLNNLLKATHDNPEWVKATQERNKKLSKDPEWREKVSDGLISLYANNPKLRKVKSDKLKKYWTDNGKERKTKSAKTMQEMILKNLKNPEYIKWRLENPPGGKPILFNNKYFRSTQEASTYFKISRQTIERHILQKREGCAKLNKNRVYKFEIQY